MSAGGVNGGNGCGDVQAVSHSDASRKGVGSTALGVAWARAIESRRSDRLINDPLAHYFVPDETVELPGGFKMSDSLINIVA